MITVGLTKMLSMSYLTILYEVERRVLRNRVQEVGCEWNLTGILGSEGEGERIRIIRKALFKFLNYTGLMRRIWAVKRTWCYTLLYNRWRYAPKSCLQSAINQEKKRKRYHAWWNASHTPVQLVALIHHKLACQPPLNLTRRIRYLHGILTICVNLSVPYRC